MPPFLSSLPEQQPWLSLFSSASSLFFNHLLTSIFLPCGSLSNNYPDLILLVPSEKTIFIHLGACRTSNI
jgi:hypothetical protein